MPNTRNSIRETPARRRARVASKRARRLRTVTLTAAYTRAEKGWIMAEILEAEGVYTQGRTIEEARENLLEALGLALEQAPEQIGTKRQPIPAGALTETIFLAVPAA